MCYYGQRLHKQIDFRDFKGNLEDAIQEPPKDGFNYAELLMKEQWRYFSPEAVFNFSRNLANATVQHGLGNLIGHKFAYATRFATDMEVADIKAA